MWLIHPQKIFPAICLLVLETNYLGNDLVFTMTLEISSITITMIYEKTAQDQRASKYQWWGSNPSLLNSRGWVLCLSAILPICIYVLYTFLLVEDLKNFFFKPEIMWIHISNFFTMVLNPKSYFSVHKMQSSIYTIKNINFKILK